MMRSTKEKEIKKDECDARCYAMNSYEPSDGGANGKHNVQHIHATDATARSDAGCIDVQSANIKKQRRIKGT